MDFCQPGVEEDGFCRQYLDVILVWFLKKVIRFVSFVRLGFGIQQFIGTHMLSLQCNSSSIPGDAKTVVFVNIDGQIQSNKEEHTIAALSLQGKWGRNWSFQIPRFGQVFCSSSYRLFF